MFFAPDAAETSTIQRVRAFLEHGFELTSFAFRRGRYNAAFEPFWRNVPLGQTWDGRYAGRALALLKSLPILWRHRRTLRGASILFARNIDQLALAFTAKLLFRRDAALVYEVLDIAEPLTGSGLGSRLLRAAERLLLGQVRLLVVSSPGFVRNYFRPVQNYAGPWHLLENKLHPAALAEERLPEPNAAARGERPHGRRWVIGYFGLIRGQRTFELMTRLAERFPEDLQFCFRGVVTTLEERQFHATLARMPNMVYGGTYRNPEDLPALYGSVDFVWAIDLENADHNSRWLMPCRFYEGGYFAVPSLAAKGFKVGDRVEALGAGWTFEAPYEETLAAFFASLTAEDYERKRAALRALPRALFASADDAEILCRRLDAC